MSNFINSKNNVSGRIRAKGDVHIGDVNNYHFKGVEYEDLLEKVKDYEEMLADATNGAKRLKYSEKLNQAKAQLEAFKKEVIDLAELFQKIELDTERLKLAKQHFDAGEFKEARAILNAEQMTQELDSLLAEKERLHKNTQQNQAYLQDKANEFLILAKLTAINYELEDWLKKAIEYFEKSLQAHRNNQNLYEYAVFLHKHGKLDQAKILYEEIIKTSSSRENSWYDLFNLATALNNLAALYEKEHKFDLAEKYYKKTLKISKNLAKTSTLLIQWIAQVTDNLAIVYTKENKFNEAKKLYTEALAIQRKLSNKVSKEFSLHLAQTANNYGNLLLDHNYLDEAKQLFTEALEIRRKFAKKAPNEHLHLVATTLSNFGMLYRQIQEYQKAEELYIESKEIREKLSKQNPYSFLPDLAMVLNNLGNLYSDQKKVSKAKHSLEEALRIYIELCQQQPAVYLYYVIGTEVNLACFHTQTTHNKIQTLKHIDEALNNIKPIIHIPHIYQQHLQTASDILQTWGINPKTYFKDKLKQ